MMPKTIVLGADHAGFEQKEAVKNFLLEKGYLVLDKGTHTTESVDYPDFIHPVAKAIEEGDAALGIIFCGSGNGVAMTANKHAHIRAALAWLVELAELARQHNDANVLSIPSRYVSTELAIQMVDAFLNTDFEGGRHQRRVDKIAC
jgi:ribose 5-phosphate isomerase B